MGKRVNPAFLLKAFEDNCDEVIFTSSEQTTRAGAQGVALGTLPLTASDFTISAGAGTDAEKITLASQSITWSGTGTVSHACFFNTTTGDFICCSTATTNKLVNSGDSGSINGFDVWEIGDAT